MRQAIQSLHEEEFPGRILIEAIRMEMATRELSVAQAAEACGLGYKYFSALMAGDRPFSHLKYENFRPIAKFLHTSVIQVMVWADAIGLEDFHNEDSLPYLLQVSFIKMRNDPHWGILLPSSEIWEHSALEIKIALILMYEKLSGDMLLDKVKVGNVTDVDGGIRTVRQANFRGSPLKKRKTPQQ